MDNLTKPDDFKCRYCGDDLGKGEAYCRACGRSVKPPDDKDEAEFPEQGQRLHRRRILKAALYGIPILIIFILAGISISITSNSQIPVAPAEKKPVEKVVKQVVGLKFEAGVSYGPGGAVGLDPKGQAAWIADLGLEILSSPVVSDNAVLVVSSDVITGESSDLSTNVIALNARNIETGAEIWSAKLPSSRLDTAEVIAAGGMIYIIGSHAKDGTTIFKVDSLLGGNLWPAGKRVSEYPATSAVLAGDVLCITTESNSPMKQRQVLGVDTTRGDVIWTDHVDTEISPLAEAGGYVAYVESWSRAGNDGDISNAASLVVLDPFDGVAVVRKKLGFAEPSGAPVFTGKGVLITGVWAVGRMLVEYYDLSNVEGEASWKWDGWLAGNEPPPSGFAIAGDYCFFAGPGGVPVAINMTTGPDPTGNASPAALSKVHLASPPLSNGTKVFFQTMDSKIIEYDPVKGSVAWKLDLPEGYVPAKDKHMAYSVGKLFYPVKGGVLMGFK